jgi:hypothetical protein
MMFRPETYRLKQQKGLAKGKDHKTYHSSGGKYNGHCNREPDVERLHDDQAINSTVGIQDFEKMPILDSGN